MTSPNIIFIMADDMGYGDFARFNNGLSRTPHLDLLMDQGICLTQHYSASAVCAPARAGLLTGRYPQRTGAVDTLDARGLDRIATRETTIADLLKANGYTTGLIGKWHNGAGDPAYHPNRRGFDEFIGFRGGWIRYFNYALDYNTTSKPSDGTYVTDLFTDEACRFIRRHHKKPFFLNLSYNAPHFPLDCPDEDIQPFEATGQFNNAVNRIYGMIRRMDAGIGKVLQTLTQLGIHENTIVIFTSDNGPQFGGDGQWCTDRFNCNFNGCKGNVYEGGIRVPGIVRWPERIKPGTQSDKMVHFNDWMPTLLTAAGVEQRPDLPLDGENILPTLCGDDQNVNPVRFWQWNRYAPVYESNAAMRDGDWKLLRPPIPAAQRLEPGEMQRDQKCKDNPKLEFELYTEPLPEPELGTIPEPLLFNIADDPGETTNLAEQHPQKRDQMLSQLVQWSEQVETDRLAACQC